MHYPIDCLSPSNITANEMYDNDYECARLLLDQLFLPKGGERFFDIVVEMEYEEDLEGNYRSWWTPLSPRKEGVSATTWNGMRRQMGSRDAKGGKIVMVGDPKMKKGKYTGTIDMPFFTEALHRLFG